MGTQTDRAYRSSATGDLSPAVYFTKVIMGGSRLMRVNSARLGFLLFVLTSSVAALLTLTLIICGYIEAWHVPYFEQRFAPTIGLAHGQLIYQIRPTAPLFCSIYGPLSYIAFLPAAVFHTVQAVFLAGSLESTAFLVLPFLLLAYTFVRKYHLPLRDWGPLLLFPITAIASLRPLNYTATLVSADSPSICFTALSALILYFYRGKAHWTIAAASSLALTLGIGCKQNMILAALIILPAVFLSFPRRFWWSYLAFFAAFSVLALGVVEAVYHDFGAIYFNNVVIPSHYPVITANFFTGTYRLFENGAVLALVLTSMGAVLFLTQGSKFWSGGLLFGLTFFAIALVLSVPSIRIYAASGGDINDFAHAIYFFLLGIVVTGFEIQLIARSQPRPLLAVRFVTVVATITLLGSGLPTRYDAEWKTRMSREPAAIAAYEYSRRHPGDVYFPNNPIGVYLGEHRFYHTEWGVMIPKVAGEHVDVKDIFKFIPHNARYVAVPRDYIPDGKGAIAPFVAPHFLRESVAGLEGFQVYKIEREATATNANESRSPIS